MPRGADGKSRKEMAEDLGVLAQMIHDTNRVVQSGDMGAVPMLLEYLTMGLLHMMSREISKLRES
jgi:hypothetical protein